MLKVEVFCVIFILHAAKLKILCQLVVGFFLLLVCLNFVFTKKSISYNHQKFLKSLLTFIKS